MPKYLLVLADDESAYADPDADLGWLLEQHTAFTQAVRDDPRASVLGGEALVPTPTAWYLRGTRTPDVRLVDNPTPDVKEVLGGYYLVEAADDAHALELAKQCPSPFGHVELRRVWEFET